MNIVADENIPAVHELFEPLGEVRTLPGRAITRAELARADLLLTRSVTRVDAALVEGTPVRFVATATSGTDHVDEACLKARGIAFASAPGSNAAGVADWVAVALSAWAARRGMAGWGGKTLAVIGYGHVGSRVAARAQALGMRVLVNDPPLARRTGDPLYRPLDEVLRSADVVSLHCCLTHGGPDPSHHLADDRFFDRLRPGCLFINTARGEVADETALHAALDAGVVSDAILDVWENEPAPDPRLIRRAAVASPHIGGYSQEGRLRGAQMIYEAACRFVGRAHDIDLLAALPAPEPITAHPPATDSDPADPLAGVLRQVHDVDAETGKMKKLAELAEEERAGAFDRLRRAHGPRREFAFHTVRLPPHADHLRQTLRHLGFQIPD